jgi:hypothetical protein
MNRVVKNKKIFSGSKQDQPVAKETQFELQHGTKHTNLNLEMYF